MSERLVAGIEGHPDFVVVSPGERAPPRQEGTPTRWRPEEVWGELKNKEAKIKELDSDLRDRCSEVNYLGEVIAKLKKENKGHEGLTDKLVQDIGVLDSLVDKLQEEKYSLYAKWAERGEEIKKLTKKLNRSEGEIEADALWDAKEENKKLAK